MKKRAQTPDAYTYTLLFRGFARYASESHVLGRALKIYHSMFGDNAPVKPTIIHTNAMLQICAKAKDTDTMFAIAAKLPEKGVGAPDNVTFTTIINAVRVVAWSESSTSMKSEKQRYDRRQEAVLQGRRMWVDVISKWKVGHLVMDEELVCAMGRLLLLGDMVADCDDVLSLLYQTMRIQRLLPRLGDPARKTHLRNRETTTEPSQKSHWEIRNADTLVQDLDRKTALIQSDARVLARKAKGPELELTSEFDPLPSSHVLLNHAIPGQNTLSLITDACARMRALGAAQGYWKKITREVKPDLENYHMYLRVLRTSRASSTVVEIINNMTTSKHNGESDVGPVGKTFRLSLSVCNRDSNNSSALKNGNHIMRLMLSTLENVDMRTLELFQQLIRRRDSKNLWHIDDVCNALDVIQKSFQNLKSALAWEQSKEHDRAHVVRKSLLGNRTEASGAAPATYPDEAQLKLDRIKADTVSIARLIETEYTRAVHLYRSQLTDKLLLQWQHARAAAISWYSRQYPQRQERKDEAGMTTRKKRPEKDILRPSRIITLRSM